MSKKKMLLLAAASGFSNHVPPLKGNSPSWLFDNPQTHPAVQILTPEPIGRISLVVVEVSQNG